MRPPPDRALPVLRRDEQPDRTVLRRLRLPADRGRGAARRPPLATVAAPRTQPATRRRTPPRHGPLRRPRRVHGARRRPRRRGRPRAADPLLRHVARDHRALRRHRREVHRRRGHGRLGRAGRPRGRRRAGRSRRPRARRGRPRPRAGRPGPRRRPDRRGRGHARRERPGDGRRRPRQHRLAAPVRGRARHGPRRRGDPASRVRRDRLRARRRPGPQGQGSAGRRLAGPPRRRRAQGPRPERPARGAVRRSRRRSCACSRTSSTPPPASGAPGSSRSPGQAGIGKSRLAWEFLKYVDGVVEGVWWHDGRSPAYGEGVTFWALGEMVRCARRPRSRPTTRRRPATKVAEMLADARPGRGRTSAGSSRRCWRCSASARRRPAVATSCSGRGGPSSSGSRRPAPSASCSRTSSGRTPASSTSSTTCSNGAAASRS